jgi:flap endonuclease-1
MGIKGLTSLIAQHAPKAIQEHPLDYYFHRTIAIDASMALYAFNIAIRSEGIHSMTDEEGESTSHLIGLFYRTLKLLKRGITPIYVFDGTPPDLKQAEIQARRAKKADADAKLLQAISADDIAEQRRQSKRNVRVSAAQIAESKRLLDLMGIPYLEAPSEAESQCAVLVKQGLAWAVGTEDMDALTCGAPILLRNLHASEAQSKKKLVKEIRLERVLEDMELSMSEFIDLCILCGCDYSDKIRGIGPKRAYALIKKYRTLEEVLAHLDPVKYPRPDPFPYEEIRAYFRQPPSLDLSHLDACQLKRREADVEGLIHFLVVEKGFEESRLESSLRFLSSRRKHQTQTRMTDFFKPV